MRPGREPEPHPNTTSTTRTTTPIIGRFADNDAILWPLGDGTGGLLASERNRRRLEVAAAVRIPHSDADGICIVPVGADIVGAALLAGIRLHWYDPETGTLRDPRRSV